MSRPYPEFDGSQVCAQTDPEIWFPSAEAQSGRLAKTLCQNCPWLIECREYSLFYDVRGIWGGTNERQRMELRKVRNIKPEPMTFESLISTIPKLSTDSDILTEL